jgi:hypothetical protein
MSTEERLRDAARARADLVRDIRPLELPEQLPARGGRFGRAPGHHSRHWLNWGAPLAAAAVVALVAVLLVVGRQAPAPPASPPAPVASPSAAVPRYYVKLAWANATVPGAPTTEKYDLVAGDDQAGRTLATIAARPGETFTGVTGAADDRTFVVRSYRPATKQSLWYLLRLAPGTSHPATLSSLPVPPLPTQVNGLALSPDGHEVAVMFEGSALELRTYSVSTGALLGSWQTSADYWMLRDPAAENAYGLSWSASGAQVAFRFDGYASGSTYHMVDIRVLDVSAAGHNLLAASRQVLQLPLAGGASGVDEPCFASLVAPDGKAVVCGTTVQAPNPPVPNPAPVPLASLQPTFASYSAATGRQLRTLYRFPGGNLAGSAAPLWTDASAQTVIGVVTDQQHDGTVQFGVGVISAGRFTLLPGLTGRVAIAGDGSPLTLIPGSIAF